MREKCRSTRSHPLEARRLCRSKSASSIIEVFATLVTTSMSTDAASMGTQRNEATMLITGGLYDSDED